MDKIFELQEQRMTAVNAARSYAEKTDAESVAAYNKAMDEVSAIDAQISRIEAARRAGETAKVEAPKADQATLFANALTGSRSAIESYRNEYTLGTAATAGNITAPMQFVEDLIKGIDSLCPIRGAAHRTPKIGPAASLGFPYLKADFEDADWKTEVAASTEATSLQIGRREFKPNRLTKLAKISRTLVSHANLAESVVRDRMAAAIARTLEKAYMTGDGSAKPLGLFTADNNGISTGRDVTAAINADAFIDLKYSIKGQYHPGLSFVMHRDIVKTVAKLKDSNGQYLWQPSLIAGQPDTLLGIPVIMSEYAPNTTTAGSYVAVLGDLSKYWICDADAMTVQVLNELYAVNNEVGYMFSYFGDGAPVVEEAFARLKVSA